MSSAWSALASLTLDSSPDDTARYELPSGSRSLILEFSEADGIQQIGARVTTLSGVPLVPGLRDEPISIDFWAPEAEMLVQVGVRFLVWYGAQVGEGVVTGLRRSGDTN